jgi:hypothetical protein
MAKFKAGDMIIGNITMSDGEVRLKVYMVNRIVPSTEKYVWDTEHYSLDNGDGFIDARATVTEIDAAFELCSEVNKRNKK